MHTLTKLWTLVLESLAKGTVSRSNVAKRQKLIDILNKEHQINNKLNVPYLPNISFQAPLIFDVKLRKNIQY